MAGAEPGTFRDTATGATYALPSSFAPYGMVGPVTREEFEALRIRVDTFGASIQQAKPDAVAAMVAAVTAEDEGDGTRH